MERKLTAILSADVCGYSRLVEDDDEATIRTLTRYRAAMQSAIESHHGHVVDFPGDNLLAEFQSVVDAVRCAVDLQRQLHEANAPEPSARRMLFRMGINVGDVVVEDAHLYGDGVNIAARLESLAEPGGICLSGSAYEQVEGRLHLDYEFMGEHHVKNISKPVAVWRIRTDADTASAQPRGADPARVFGGSTRKPRSAGPARDRKRRAWIAAAALALGAAAIVLTTRAPIMERAPAIAGKGAGPHVAPHGQNVNERPTILVLPFANMSDDPDQEYFSSGFTEDLTTDLSKLDSLFVVPGHVALRYTGPAINVAALDEELGVRYVLEGSVRKLGEQVRITARLVDVADNRQLWSERYDRPLTDIFEVQDSIRGKILTALRVTLSPAERERFERARTTNLEAYDFYLRAQAMSHRARRELRRELIGEAVALYEQAIALDPGYATAYAALGLAQYVSWLYDWNDDGDAALARAVTLYDKAISLDGSNPLLLGYMAQTGTLQGQYAKAVETAATMLERLPRDPGAAYSAAVILLWAGHFERALELLERAQKIHPRFPAYSYWAFGVVYDILGRREQALDLLKQATLRAPNYLTNQVVLTIVYQRAGLAAQARSQAQEILRISPDYEAENVRKRMPFRDERIREAYIAALRQAGIP